MPSAFKGWLRKYEEGGLAALYRSKKTDLRRPFIVVGVHSKVFGSSSMRVRKNDTGRRFNNLRGLALSIRQILYEPL